MLSLRIDFEVKILLYSLTLKIIAVSKRVLHRIAIKFAINIQFWIACAKFDQNVYFTDIHALLPTP